MHLNPPKFQFRQWPFLFPLTGIIAGIIFQETFRPEKVFWLVCFLSSFLVCLLSRLIRHRAHLFRVLALWLPFLFAGGVLRSYEDYRYAPEWYGNHLTESTALLVEITGRPEIKPATLFIPVRVIGYQKSGEWLAGLGKLNLYLYKSMDLPTYQSGDRLLIPTETVPLRPAGGSLYGFDYAAYMALNNTFHQSFLSADQIVHLPSPDQPSLTRRLRQNILHSLDQHIPDAATRALSAAVLLNHRADMEAGLLQAYSTTGITHIIAISGMHVSVLFGLFLILLKWIRHRKYEWIKYLLAVPLVWGYILLTDYPPSAVRAGIMFSFLAVGIALRKPANPINLLAATAFVLLCFKPSWLYDVGVQLSFLAVLSILIFYKPISTLVPAANKVLKLFWNSIAVCLAAQILVFPLVIYYFHQFPVWVLPANVPATFFSLLLMVGTLAILGLDALGLPASWLGELLSLMTQGFHKLIYFFSGHAPDFSSQLYLNKTDFWILMVAIMALSVFILRQRKWFAYVGLSLMAFLIGGQFFRDIFARQQEELVVYPIGQQSFTDYYTGKRVWTLGTSPDSLNEKTFRYKVFPNRLGHRAVQTAGHLKTREAFLVHEKRILYLREPPGLPDSIDFFKVDFLILSDRTVWQAQRWLPAFLPEKIILDGSFPAWKAKKWATIFQSLGIPVHNVRDQGAWHFPSAEQVSLKQ